MVSTLGLRFLAMVDTVGLITLWYVAYVYTVNITQYIADQGALSLHHHPFLDTFLDTFLDPNILFWTIWGVLVMAVVSAYYVALYIQYKGLLFLKFEIWPRLRDHVWHWIRENVWPWIRNGAEWRYLLLRWRQRRPPPLPRSPESSIWSDCENPAHY